MNKRIIDEFVLNARDLATTDTTDGGKRFDLDLFHRKFAELIVRECAEYAEHNLDMAGYKKKFMLKHFGVKQ